MRLASRLRFLIFTLAIGGLAALFFFLPVKAEIERFFGWVKQLGTVGPIVVAAAYIPATVFMVPGSLITLFAGAAFGVVTGTIAISIGSTAGAAAAFWVGRTLARAWVQDLVAGYPRFQALDRAVAEQGFKIVLLTRLSPFFPFTVLNYAFSLTQVRFRDYLLASWIGMLPGTVMYVYLGSAARELTDITSDATEGGTARRVLFFVGLLATVVVTLVVTRLARQALRRASPDIESAARGEPNDAHL